MKINFGILDGGNHPADKAGQQIHYITASSLVYMGFIEEGKLPVFVLNNANTKKPHTF